LYKIKVGLINQAPTRNVPYRICPCKKCPYRIWIMSPAVPFLSPQGGLDKKAPTRNVPIEYAPTRNAPIN
jgi:hypothetical protein